MTQPIPAMEASVRPGVELEPSPSGTLPLPAVCELLALPAATIRSWERLLAIEPADRDAQGQRWYSVSDVAALRRLRDERAADPDADPEADRSPVPAGPPTPLDLCRQLLSATDTLDDQHLHHTLDRSVDALGLHRSMDEVLLPSMREIGTRWSRGGCTTAQEHLATRAVLSWLRQKSAEAPPPLDERPVVLTCGPLDQHTVALDAFDVLLRHARFDCRNMGAQTPVASLQAGLSHCSAQAVVLVSHLATNRAAAAAALKAVQRSGVTLFYAGAAFRSQATRRGLPGSYLRGNLGQAAADITSRLRPPEHPSG